MDELFLFPNRNFRIGDGTRARSRPIFSVASVYITVCYLKGCFLLCILTFFFYLVLEVGLWGEIQSLLSFSLLKVCHLVS